MIHVLSCFCHVRLFATPVDCSLPGSSVHGVLQARILEWLPCPPPEDLPDPGIKPESLTLAGGFFVTSTTWDPCKSFISKAMHQSKARQVQVLPPGLMVYSCLVYLVNIELAKKFLQVFLKGKMLQPNKRFGQPNSIEHRCDVFQEYRKNIGRYCSCHHGAYTLGRDRY